MKPVQLVHLAVAGAVAMFTVAVDVVIARPASAVTGLTPVVAHSPMNYTETKSVTAVCPTGTVVLGGGGYSTDGAHRVHMRRMVPNRRANSFSVTASTTDHYGESWQVSAYAMCGSEPAGLQYVYNSSVSVGSAWGVAVSCPAGKKLIGVGAEIIGGGGDVILHDVSMSSELTTATAWAVEDQTGTSASWSLRSHGVCTDPLPGQQRVSAQSVADSADKTVAVSCPAGTTVHGLGGTVMSGHGQVLITELAPLADLSGMTLTAQEDHTGFFGNWRATASAVCAS